MEPDKAHAAQSDALHKEICELREALRSRTMTSQAVGMLMERYKISSYKAWSLLVRTSKELNVRVRDLAQRMSADPSGQDAYPEMTQEPN